MTESKETCYKGTRILIGNHKRQLLKEMTNLLIHMEFTEISMPIIQFQETFAGKVGEENNNLMFNFKDRGDRDLCLAPEYTAVVQKLAPTTFKDQKDVKLFYVQECFRGEKPQSGRWRQFTQLGVEILNPTKDHTPYLINLSKRLLSSLPKEVSDCMRISTGVARGLDYYKKDSGFEISFDELGSAKQVCGGGEYENGIGFALGIDRILLLT